jgi:enamine deaminase RidA (YjgF/YER057c/UK114 family)
MSAEAKWSQLAAEHPPPSKPKGLYKPLVIVGSLAFTSGHLPALADGTIQTGRLGEDLDENDGYAAARRAGMAILATLRAELGSLDRVRRVIKVVGMVQGTPEFQHQPAVINGCSELLAEVFGPQAGVGARCAFGAASLPLGAAVEIDAIFEIAET